MSATDFYKRNGCFKRCPGGFSVQAARNYNHRHDGPTDYAKCVRKYKIGGTAHTPFVYNHQRGCVCRRKKRSPVDFSTGPNTQGNIRIAAEISELHEVNQDPDDGMTMVPSQDIQNDTEYACPVTIGTPGETLTLDFDTGSADLWVWSSQARVSKADMKGRGIYDPKKSRTSKRLRGHTWEVRYGDGSSASGVVYMDTIVIGDITVENQAVEVARELSDDFLQAGCDGLVGLGQKTPMENMVEQGVIKDPIFTVKLDKRDSRGFYTFGFIDETVHCSKFYWQDVDKENGWWEVPSAYIKIGDQIYNRGQENTAIIDTGTTLVLLDDETVERLYSKIEGAAYDEDQGTYLVLSLKHAL
ncbi:Eukaryotic aspartyl protease, partial [Rhizoctonia solani]